ncbi:hypothetical protein OFB99_24080, partial [Escherichia coli]|nr:hypothetical protein [Escherichia coli]
YYYYIILYKKPPSATKKTLTLKALGVIASLNKLESKIVMEVIVFSAGLINLLYNNAPVKLITFEKVRKYLLKEI